MKFFGPQKWSKNYQNANFEHTRNLAKIKVFGPQK